MKKFLLILLVSLFTGLTGNLFAQNRFWVAATASNWNNTANWSTTSGGPGGASIPGTGGSEVPVFNANGSGNCNLDITPIVPGITVNGYTGTIDLAGRNLTTTGASTFTTGTISNSGAPASVVLNTTLTTTFNGTLFNANITGSSARIFFNGSTFNGTVNVTKTDNNTDNGTGSNTFNNTLTLIHSGTGEFRLGNTNPDIFSAVILTINNTGNISLARTGVNNQFNQNITANYNSTGEVMFGANGGTSTLASGRTISVGTVGGSGCGNLSLRNFTQVGSTAQTITLSGNTAATLTFNNSNFAAAVNLTSPRYAITASTFQGTVTLVKPDGGSDNLAGGNTFQGVTTITNNGTGELNFGNTNPDIFNNNLTLTNTSSGRIQIGLNAAGNQINGNLTINFNGNSNINCIIARNAGSTVTINGTVTLNNNNTDTGGGIILANDGAVTINGNIIASSTNGRGVYFGNASGTVTQIGGGISTGTFTGGTLSFSRFTQTGTSANTATLTGSTTLNINNTSTFGGSVNFRAPMFTTNGTTFNGVATLEKTSGSDNYWGGNTFQGTTTITNTSAAEIFLGNTNADTFNGAATFNNNGGYRIRIAYNHPGQTTTFAQPVILNSNKVSGSDPWSFLVGEVNDSHVTFQQSLTMNIAGTLRSDHRFLNGVGSIGTFNGPVTINETNTHASTIVSMGVNGISSYAENIVLTNSGGANGVVFNNNATASSTLATGKTISISGGFVSGVLNLLRFTQLGNTSQTLNPTGTTSMTIGPNSQFGGNVNFSASRLYLNGCTYGGAATLEKTGAFDDVGTGGNIFQGVTAITNSGGGYLLSANVNPDIFNGDVTITNSGLNYIYLAHNVTGNEFNGNIVLNNTGSALGIRFSNNAAAGATFNAGTTRKISIGGSGFNTGELGLRRFAEIGTSSQALALTGTASLVVGPNSQFDGNVNFNSPRLFLNGCTYGGTGTFEKTGDLDDAGNGGNIFTGVTTITNSGLRYLLLGNGTRDQFLSATTFNNTGAFRIYFAHNHPGQTTEFLSTLTLNSNKSGGTDGWSYLVAEGTNSNISVAGLFTVNCAGTLQSNHRFLTGGGSIGTFAGLNINLTNSNPATVITMGENGTSTYSADILVSNSGGAAGITFNANASASSTLNGSIISGVFSSGSLNLYRFAQLGSTPQNLALTGSGTILRLGPDSRFDGNVNFVSPRLLLHGAVYNGSAYLEKNGISDDGGSGGNIFNGTTTLVNSGTGYLLTANTAPDIFNGDLTVTNSSTSHIYLAYNVPGNEFNGNITLNNTGLALGIRFSHSVTGSATFNAGTNKTISVGGIGYSTGELGLRRFTQTGTSAQTLNLTGSTTFLVAGPSSQFDGNVTFSAPRIFLHGAIYNGTASLEKTGASGDDGFGGNTFNGVTTLTNSGSGYLLTANTTPDVFNSDLTVMNSGSSYIYLAHNVPGNQFNGNIAVNNTGSALGIRFCNNATGAATFNAGTNKAISVGSSGFTTGELGLRRFTQLGTAPQALTLTGSITFLVLGPSSEFNGNVTFISPRIFLQGTRYNGTAYLEKTGPSNDDGTGGNTFNQTATIVNSGSNYLLTGSTNPDIFNSTLILLNNGSSTIRLADNSAGNQFNGNIELNSASGGGIYFGNNANGTSTLAATRTIAVGSSGFITGDVRLIRFTQVSATPQTLNLGGIAILTLGPSSAFDGNVDFRSPQLLLQGTTFNGTSYLEKKGAIDNYSNGGNIFVGSSTIVDSGAGYLAMALNFPDIFQSDLTVTNTGSNIIYLANNVPGNQFNGNITFNSTLGSQGIYIGNNATAAATLGNGASLLTGGLGFSSGELRLKRLTQIGIAPQTLTLTGTALLRIGPATTFNGNVTFRSPQIALDGALYNGITYLEKTGASNNDSNGGNSFQGTTTTIANSGTGWFRFAVNTLDTFGSGDLILTNTGTSVIRMADNVPGTVFNGNIFVNSTFGAGIYFGESATGTASLAAGRTIAVGASGFHTGELHLRRFTQADAATPQTLLLTGTAALVLGPTIAFSGASDFRAPQVYMQGGTFNGSALIEKTGATNNTGNGGMTFNGATTLRLSGPGQFRTNGGNVFNGVTSIINTGSNDMLFELTTASNYNADLTLTNTGSSNIRMAYMGASTFGGNILVNSTNGVGIYFGESATGFATLAAGRTIATGVTGFNIGDLRLLRFTQTGTTAQNIALTGSAGFRTGPATTWGGNVTAIAPTVYLEGSTFNGTANITKTGTTTDGSNGGNIFNGASTFTNTAAGGIFRFATAAADDFVGNATFVQTNGTIQPAYNIASTFRGDVTSTGAAAIVFGSNNGTAVFTGTAANQNVNKGGAASPTFRRLTMNKAAGTVTLNTDANISTSATFTSGIMNTTATNFLNFADDATTTGASNASFVDGPVRKTGNDAFTFPIGDVTFYRPAAISAPSNTGHFFTAQYFKADHGFASTGDPSFTSVSRCEYWTIDRNPNPGSNVLVTLSWQEAACVPGYITNPATLRVARWGGSSWINLGNGGTTGSATAGTIITSAAVSTFGTFTLASTTLSNPLPVELVWFKASITSTGTGLLEWHTESELNNDRFEIERTQNGKDFEYLGFVDGSGTTNDSHTYQFEDKNPVLGLVYYRLKQVDFNDDFEYSNLVSLDFTGAEFNSGSFNVAPNPISMGSYAAFKAKTTNGTSISIRQSVTVYNNMNQVVGKYTDVDGFSIEGLAAGIYIVRNTAGEIFRLVVK